MELESQGLKKKNNMPSTRVQQTQNEPNNQNNGRATRQPHPNAVAHAEKLGQA
jgi:hypothetical protein